MIKTVLFGTLNLGHWNLFDIWCLGFGAYPKLIIKKVIHLHNPLAIINTLGNSHA
jgi:hypothetical protein